MKFASIFSRQLSKLAKSHSKHTFDDNDAEPLVETIDLSEQEALNEPAWLYSAKLTETAEPVIILMPTSEFDPALASRDFIISDKPIRPLIKYPTANKRKFVKAWYANYPWLEYSIHADAAFCFPCRKFSKYDVRETAFVSTGM